MKKKNIYFTIVLLIIVSFIAYNRILGNGFVNYDDDQYITENSHISSGINLDSIKWALTSIFLGNWHPLTLLSHMLDWSLFGANASGHHLISLLLHIGSIIFLFLFLNRTTKDLWTSAFAAAFFALHPLRVESVAWAAERKDVLSMFFGLLALYTYAHYAEKSQLSKYLLCLILFSLALLAKPMLVTFPFILLLLDYWPLGRWTKELSVPTIKNRHHLVVKLLLEKLPFVVLTIISSVITVLAQKKAGMVISLENLPLSSRIANAVFSYIAYLGKTFWPVDLTVFYPYEYSFPLWQFLFSCFILISITVVVIYTFKKFPFLFVGWVWYLGTLIPVIGLVQVGAQAMADRYSYLPSIGIAIMLAWGVPLLFSRENVSQKVLSTLCVATLTILGGVTWQQCGYWKTSIELWNHNLQIVKDNYVAQKNLGLALSSEGRVGEAIYHYNKAIRIAPYDANTCDTYNDRGVAYNKLNQHEQAVKSYNQAIHLKPDYTDAYYNRGLSYGELGMYQLAVKDFNKAIQLNPNHSRAYNNRGVYYDKLGKHQLAIEDFDKAISLTPNYVRAYNNRGLYYDKLGQYPLAIDNFNKALSLKPDYADVYNNRSNSYLNQGDEKLSCNDAKKACELGKCSRLNAFKGKRYCR